MIDHSPLFITALLILWCGVATLIFYNLLNGRKIVYKKIIKEYSLTSLINKGEVDRKHLFIGYESYQALEGLKKDGQKVYFILIQKQGSAGLGSRFLYKQISSLEYKQYRSK